MAGRRAALSEPPAPARRPDPPRGALPAASPWRRPALPVALLAALGLHGLLGRPLADLFAPLDQAAAPMARIQAAYTRSVQQAEPVGPAPTSAPAPTTAAPAPPARPGATQARALDAAALAAERAARRARALAAVQAALAAAAAASAAESAASSVAPSVAFSTAPSTAAWPGGAGPAVAVPPVGAAAAARAAATDAAAAASPSVAASSAAEAATAAAPPGLAASLATAASAAQPGEAAAALTPAAAEPLLADGQPWPRSTRLSYRLSGWYHGEVPGQAQVEWLREGWRYQVHLEVSLGPALAPLATRRMSSEGRITAQGLAPQRYLQRTTQLIGRSREARIAFEADAILLDRGRRLPRPDDVQDTASQFIQMVYLFTTRPALREAGQEVAFALALPHRVDRWAYDVGPLETVDTPLGPLQAFHVRPRRAAAPGDLSVEIWYAPRLQLLPVRIFIRQDADTWADLRLERAPEQAAR